MNGSIISVLQDLAFFLELSGANPFKTKAIVNGARVIRGFDQPVSELLESGELKKTKGIGKGILTIVEEVLEKGKSSELQELASKFPDRLIELRDLQGLGPKKIKTLYQELQIASLAELEYACNENRLLDLKGFGQKSQDKIMAAIEELNLNRGKVLLPVAEHIGNALVSKLGTQSTIKSATIVGELRRLSEVVENIDILIEEKKDSGSEVKKVLKAQGVTLSKEADSDWSIVGCHENGVGVRVFSRNSKSKKSHFAYLAELTGPESIAKKLLASNKVASVDSEESAFQEIKLPYFPPELRDANLKIKKSPKLVEEEDIQGVFHLHTTASDGANTLKEMAEKCRELGLKYMGVSDHSQSAFYAGGLKADAILKQRDEVDALNSKYDDFIIFHGIESDILPNGDLDYPTKVLEKFDFVIASIHNQFQMKPADMTKRICKALKNPHTTWLGHPTGRLLLGRKGYEFDFDAVFETAAKHGKGIELNSNPYRLDLDWRLLQSAAKNKIDIGIFPDAHSVNGLEDYRYGVMMARKGGLTAAQIGNTKSASEMQTWLQQK